MDCSLTQIESQDKNVRSEQEHHTLLNGYDSQAVVSFLEFLDHGSVGGVTEIRILPIEPRLDIKGQRIFVGKTVAGYYEPGQYDLAARDIAVFDGKAQIYVCLNPCNSNLLARSKNRLQYDARHTAKDEDILCVRWLPIDCDPIRPSGISSSDEEVQEALLCRDRIAAELEGLGATVVKGMSGNGGHALVRLPDYPNDQKSRELVKNVLAGLSRLGDTDRVQVDTCVGNAARVWKVYGTLAVKGDNIPSRPHRRASIARPDSPPLPFDLSNISFGKEEQQERVSSHNEVDVKSTSRMSHPTYYRDWVYAQNALQGEAAKVSNAPDGGKHVQLRNSAIALGSFVPTGSLTEQEIEDMLLGAVRDRADDPQKALKTIQDGIRYGSQRPRPRLVSSDDVFNVPREEEGELHSADSLFHSPPLPLSVALREVPPLPLGLLPAPIRDWLVDIAERLSCPLEYVAVPAIIALASLVGCKLWIRPKRYDDWGVAPNLWGATVGSPSTFKTPAANKAFRPLNKIASKAHDDHVVAVEAYQLRKEAWEAARKAAYACDDGKSGNEAGENPAIPIEKRFIVNDATVPALGQRMAENPNGLLLNRDELLGWLKSLEKENAQADRPFYLEAWNGTQRDYIHDRVGRGTLRIPHVCLSIFGTIQPGPLAQYVHSAQGGAGADGFMQRFQLLVYPDLPTWRNIDRLPNIEAENRAFAIYEGFASLEVDSSANLPEDKRTVAYVHFSSEAQGLFDEWYVDLNNTLQNSVESPAIISHFSKYRSLMPTLALIFHLVHEVDSKRSDSTEARLDGVSPVSLQATKLAAAWCDFLAEHARRIYHAPDETCMASVQLLAARLSDLPNPFTAYNVKRKGWRGLRSQDEIARALDILEDHHWICSRDDCSGKSENGGRPTRRYFLHPNVLGVCCVMEQEEEEKQ